jgi:acetolactate synthase-1/2/3 large subunit
MNGAQALIRTLVGCGVDVCFANPGTSEMHFVAALDSVPEMRGVLGLFEGVVSGAADGYGRLTGRPAATLLHLGPGLANGLANLHNARRARTPVVNVVGDHATSHKQYDAPLESDIESLARPMSGWYRESVSADHVAADAIAAVTAAVGPPGRVATLVVPADVSWLDAGTPPQTLAVPNAQPSEVPQGIIDDVAKVMRSGEPVVLLLGGSAVRAAGLMAASRIANTAGAKLMCETFPALLERGAGLPPIERLGYLAEFTQMQLAGARHLVLVDTKAPVSFFAYPGKASYLVPDGCDVHVLADAGEDAVAALGALADVIGAGAGAATLQPASRPDRPTGALTAETLAAALGALLPDGAIVSDEGNTSGLFAAGATAGAPRHDWLCLTGGAIGQGLPVATGAAIACPERPVVCLEADGSAMYTLQALWTQAREGLDVTTIVLNNGAYAILQLELSRVGAEPPGPRAQSMLDIPGLDFVSLAEGTGVPASRAVTADELTAQLQRALSEPGPHLIEAMLGGRSH